MRVALPNFWLNVLFTTALLGLQDGAVTNAANSLGGLVRPKRDLYSNGVTISGLRIEPKEPSEGSAFHGYVGNMSIIHPDQKLRVVIFGHGFDRLANISFVATSEKTVDCSTANHTLVTNHDDSFIWTNERFVVVMSFPPAQDKTSVYHICYSTLDLPVYRYLDNPYTQISTNVPPRQYYFPMYIQIVIVTILLTLSGLFSGLNLGLMSLNPNELMLIIKSGSKTERRYAESILPVRERGNLLLCSLLIGNVLVNSGISILLDDLTGSGYIALIGASAGIVVFGEIFPQSLCVKKGLAVGANTILITRFFMVLTWPIAFPISKILDCLLGEEIQSYDRKRLLELIKMNSSGAMQDELKIAVGAMEICDKTVAAVMTRIDDVFMLPSKTILNVKTVAEILRMGYTRIPIFGNDCNNVISLLFVKDLALLDPDDGFSIETVCNYHNHPLRFVMEDTPLRVMLEEFKKGDYHLAMVQRIIEHEDKDPTYDLVGVVTLEDIVEEILQAEIVDETDAFMDNVNRTRRKGGQQTRDLAGFVDSEELRVISVQMQMVTLQWLTANHRAFHSDMISQNVLEKLIRQHCRRVELTHLPHEMYARNAGIPRNAKLYTKGEHSERFILLLEGRAMVTIGQDQMTFEAGPWHAFGTEMLERLVDRCERDKEEHNHSKSSLNVEKQKIGFTPDYSVTVRDDCTYLEITANTWLLAYKTTLISRGGTRWPSVELLTESGMHRSYTDSCALTARGFEAILEDETETSRRSSHEQNEAEEDKRPLLPSFIDVENANSSPMGGRSHSRTSLDERKNLIVHPQLEAVRRNGKNRSASESEHMELLPRNGLDNSSPLSDRSVLSQI